MKEKILVLEDESASRKLLAHVLEKENFEVIESREGRYAIHAASVDSPRVIVVDVMLPDMKGTEVVQQIERLPSCKYTKVIFLTGILSERARNKKGKYLFEVNGKHFRALPKPVRKTSFLNLVKLAVAESISEQEADEKAERQAKEELREARESARQAKVEEKRKALEEAMDEQRQIAEEIPWYEIENSAIKED